MATSESAAAGAESGTPGSPVPRAAAVTVLTEEPSTGLFPAKPEAGTAAAPSSGSGTPATVSASAAPAAAEGEEPSRTEAEAETEAEAKTEAGEQPGAETAPEAATLAAVATTGAATSAETETKTAKATAATTGARRTGVLPLGRPGKPLIAAAVAGGLVLVGVPFLISGLSGSGDDTSPPSALAPAGSRMGPDGSGPGFVPGRQNAPGDKLPKSDGKPSAGSGTGGSGTGRAATGGVHEAGTKSLATGTGEVAKDAKAGKQAAPSASKSSAAKGSAGKPADKPVSTQQERVAPVTYSHFIGPGCDTPGFATSDQWRKGTEGWVGSTGSQTSYGCSGFYYSVPLSNSTTKSTGYAQWKFPTGSVTNGTCQVSVYIPNVRNISRVGGNPAHYAVHRYFEAKPSTQIDTFEIDQPSHLGQWINAGTFPVSTGKISIVLENRGRTSGNRHAAAAPIRVNCTAS
ncbi:hypothetical protein P8A22_07475 [Streptomyces laculatispora]|uniref:Translation initiation factor IF-2 n=1 Tax=Streptomyces laculatispora TaxID=887464 RepID=A0ABY9HZY1_9ACTN|nr:hypothetical protein [Streptomyces laculatispora]WLQ39866.1 hypothetical protein P8A22_07475 [Streptomyces laculatispora]